MFITRQLMIITESKSQTIYFDLLDFEYLYGCDDINMTLRHVCTKILTYNSVSFQTRNKEYASYS